MKKQKGSALVLVIMILITISVLGLLVMNYVRNMLTLSSNYFAYHKAYNMARGGTEIQLTKVAHRQIGFQDQLTGNFIDNYDCLIGVRGIKSKRCTMTSRIISMGKYLTDTYGTESCNSGSAYVLEGGDAIGFPLFQDLDESEDGEYAFNKKAAITPVFEPNIDFVEVEAGDDPEMGVALIKLEYDDNTARWVLPSNDQFSRSKVGQMKDINNNAGGAIGYALDNDLWDLSNNPNEIVHYLVVFNPASDVEDIISFCLSSPDTQIPYTVLAVESLATFKETSVGLLSTQNIDLPGFIFSTFVQR